MTAFDFDLFVIGVGSGGVRAARMSAQYGAKVATAEDKFMGGTCVNVGCIPKKLFVYASHYKDDFEEARGYGWQPNTAEFEWNTLLANKNQEIARLNGIYEGLLRNAGVTHFSGRARIKDAHTILIGDREITTEKILIATGGWPTKQDIPGASLMITSNEAFYLEDLPQRALVVGGGYIAVEFAGIFAGLGVKTELAYRGPLFLRGFDDDVRHRVADELDKKGIELAFNASLVAVERQESGGLLATFEDGRQLETDLILAATGRKPAVEDLGLENVKVAQRDNGAIIVDEDYQTSEPNIFALGDVTDRVQLTPVAIEEAMCFASTQFLGQRKVMNYDGIATAVFCQPNIATVGLTEQEARDRYPSISIYRSSFRALKATLSGSQEQSLMKLIVDDETDRVIGIHMVGSEAGEIIQGLAVAMKAGATKAIFDETVGIHPTAAEEFVTMRTSVST
jgi:glutathione reductase (NADPH)